QKRTGWLTSTRYYTSISNKRYSSLRWSPKTFSTAGAAQPRGPLMLPENFQTA
ncbi:hypothetical protein LTR60_003797, partial [Cryomyces antarcticus]